MTETLLTVTNLDIWHRRLGHLSKNKLIELEKLVDGMQVNKTDKVEKVCEVCISGKQSKLPHNERRTRARRPLELIHSDIMGPINITSWNSKKYILCFVDDFTHFTAVYFLEHKSEAFKQ